MNMKKREKIILIICSIVIFISISIYIGVKYYLNKDLEKQKENLQNIKESYGTVEKEIVEILVAKFNTEIMDNTNWSMLPVDDNNMIIHENNYWYPLYEDISLVIVPEKFTNDKTKDTVKLSFIYIESDSKYEEEAKKYFKYLIKANNENINEEDAENLIEKAEKLKEEKEASNNGKGLFVGIYEDKTNTQYQVTRNYQD